MGAVSLLLGVLLLTTGCGEPEPAERPSAVDRSERPFAPSLGERRKAPPVGDGSGGVALTEIGEFEDPVYVTQPRGDDALYVVELCGRVMRVDGESEPTVFLDVSEMIVCGGEQGLLSVAFAPDYARSGRLYVNFTGLDENSHTVEYRRSDGDDELADPGSARELLAIADPYPNHNGGLLLFDPEGRLLLGMGDGGGLDDPDRTAQDLDSHLGKILEVDVRSGETEVYAYGLRNPWRFSFDRRTGDLWIADVGRDSLEEVDAVRPRRDLRPNFGWSAFEGTRRMNEDQRAPGHVEPVHTYGHDQGCSITGGYVVRDPELRSLYGRYLYGDYCEGRLRSFTADPRRRASDDRELGAEVASLSSFGEDAAGRVYATSLEGEVYRLDPER